MKKIYSILLCIGLVAGFVACEKDKEFALTTLSINNEVITPAYNSADVRCSFKTDATVSDAYVQYALSSSFAKYEVAKMTEEKGIYVAQLVGLADNTTYYIRYEVSNKYSSVVTEEVKAFQTLQCTVPTIVLDTITDVMDSHAKVQIHLTFDGGASVTDMGVCWSTQANPTTKDIHVSTEDTLAVLDITSLQSNTKYYIRAYAMNKVGVAYSEEKEFTTYALPDVRTEDVSDIQVNSALLSATLVFDGNDTATIKGFCWSEKSEPTIEGDHIAVDTASAGYTYLLTALFPETQYFVRAYAQNKIGIVYGEEKSFTTNKSVVLPSVTTTAITKITETSAVAGGNVTSDGNATVTERGVVYGIKQNPTTDDNKLSSGSGTGEFTCNLANLQPNTIYYVRAYATNEKGTAYGEELNFTTSKQIVLPTVTTNAVTQITETTAVAGGNVTSDGNATVTERGVVYSTKQNPTISDNKKLNGSGVGSFVCDLSNLQAGTTYYVRAYAINNKGTAYGDEVSFTTAVPITLATVTTASITNITETTAKAGGTVTNDGNAAVTERGVCISTVSNPTISNTKISAGLGTGSFTCNLTGLQANTTYYVRAYAVNSKGTAYGEQVSFTTTKTVVLPSVTTSTVTQITETSAVAGGNVTSDGGASVTERGVVYSTNPNPVITNLSNTIRPCGSGTGSFTYNMTGLQSGTTYYVRAYATNEVGTAYGEEVSFTTQEQSSTPNDGTENGYAYVDLGLSVKWATMNVGASSPEDYGDYFAWGETEPKDVYEWSTYKWCNGSYTSITKYNTHIYYGTVDNKTTLELSDDAAHVNWGGRWRMPTMAEQEELTVHCTCKWTTQNGVYGCEVTSRINGNSIFLPAAGWRSGSSLYEAGSIDYYWSSSLKTIEADLAYSLNNGVLFSDCPREEGRSVRPVLGDYVMITTSIVTQITASTAVAGGNVTSDGGDSVTERGVVFATKQNPTTDDNKLTCGSGMGEFTCTLTGLQANTTYYVRAYAVNSKGITYGGQVSFTAEEKNNGKENGHEYVDLGLSVKWATMNVGASKPEAYGNYFAWGEISTKSIYDWSTYKYYDTLSSQLTKYYDNDKYGNNGLTTLELSDDAAHVNWGGSWRMPTDAEWLELIYYCTCKWTTQNGVYGCEVTSRINGNSIFLPAAGYRYNSSLNEAGSFGFYWSSSLGIGNNRFLTTASLSSSSYCLDMFIDHARSDGLSVRPVCP